MSIQVIQVADKKSSENLAQAMADGFEIISAVSTGNGAVQYVLKK